MLLEQLARVLLSITIYCLSACYTQPYYFTHMLPIATCSAVAKRYMLSCSLLLEQLT